MRFLVTCASGDIGKELCLHLAKKGHDLIITGRNRDKLEALTQQIQREHPPVKVGHCMADLGVPSSMGDLVDMANKEGIDGVVLMPPRPPILEETPEEQYETLQKAMRDCVIGPRFLLQKLVVAMEKSALKSVVLVSGTSSKQPIQDPKWEAFNDVRTAWLGVMKTFSERYAELGIRFNTVSPCQVLTPTYRERIEAEAGSQQKLFTDVLRQKMSSVPLRKFPEVLEIVKTIYFTLKSQGAATMTGDNIVIDGGMTRGYF